MPTEWTAIFPLFSIFLDCEQLASADHLQADSDVSERRNCVAHHSAHDGIQCLRRADLLKVGRVKGNLRSSMGQERLSMLTLTSIQHDLLRILDFTDRIEEFALAMARKKQFAIGLKAK